MSYGSKTLLVSILIVILLPDSAKETVTWSNSPIIPLTQDSKPDSSSSSISPTTNLPRLTNLVTSYSVSLILHRYQHKPFIIYNKKLIYKITNKAMRHRINDVIKSRRKINRRFLRRRSIPDSYQETRVFPKTSEHSRTFKKGNIHHVPQPNTTEIN